VIDLIYRAARTVEDRDDDQGGENRIKVEALAQDKGAVAAEHDERRMGDIGDVERFGWTFATGNKVMQIENDYDKEVYNGDIGDADRTRRHGELRRTCRDLWIR